LAEDQDDPPNVRGHGFGAFDKWEAHAAQPVPPQSSLTIVTPMEQPKSPKEEGTDSLLVTWNGPDDPEVGQDHLSLGWNSVIDSFSKNPMNWSHWKKIWVMCQVSLLTFSVYIGSAIYTAGIEGVMQEYHVSLVAATLGLTLFVAGYGLGALCIDV
jgi:DHA1 family multidrug resistance protein-like MFS transporter